MHISVFKRMEKIHESPQSSFFRFDTSRECLSNEPINNKFIGNFRMEIARVHLKPLKTSLDKNSLAKKIGMLTVGFSGAQIASLCNESAMIAARSLAEEITNEHFDKAFDRVKWGVQKQQPLGDKDKKVAAYHDAGHAVVGWHLPNIKPVTKVCCT